jgi:hypothetical protein
MKRNLLQQLISSRPLLLLNPACLPVLRRGGDWAYNDAMKKLSLYLIIFALGSIWLALTLVR